MKKKLFLTLMQCLAALMLLYTRFLITLDFSLNLNLRRLLTQCFHTRKNTVKYVFCVFSLEKPLVFLSRGTINSLKVSGETFVNQYYCSKALQQCQIISFFT